MQGENQLHNASLLYSNMLVYFKQNCIVAASKATELWCGTQNQYLRRADASIKWEQIMLKGKLHLHIRRTVETIRRASNLGDMGIEVAWPPLPSIHLGHPRVALSNDHASLLWDLCMSLARNRRQRLLPCSDGLQSR